MADISEIPPFRSLGYLNGVYYYYSRGEQAVVALQAGGHGKKNLYRLANHFYWIEQFKSKKDDFDENTAASALMAACQSAGIFSIKKVRGRGVWLDSGKAVIHFGDRVCIDGTDYLPHSTPGKMIYELGEALGYNPCKPMLKSDGEKLQAIINRLRWQTSDQHKWFTGWIVCSIMGGALSWRPHIWLTGGAQSGKSTLAKIMSKILGNNCLYIKSVSTEAGIRQTLKADCLPVVMDEAEREDQSSHSRLQAVLTLARQASSDDDAKIVKGTPTGNALNYQIRSCFCLSSINSNLVQAADKGRVTNIELAGVKLSGDDYDKWKAGIDALLTDEYIQSMYSRIFANVPTIVANAKELARAIERKTGDRRLGDQYGALLAGYLILSSDEVLNEETAKLTIEDTDFASEKEKAQGINDQHRLLNKIMQHILRVSKDRGFEDISIGEMCAEVYRLHSHKEYEKTLANIGIKIIGEHIAIANDNDNLGELLKSSQWPHNWAQTLSRLTFASPSPKPVYFTPSCKPRAVMLLISEVVFKEDETK